MALDQESGTNITMVKQVLTEEPKAIKPRRAGSRTTNVAYFAGEIYFYPANIIPKLAVTSDKIQNDISYSRL